MRTFDCCEHCKHDINDPLHDRRCPEGCNDAEAGILRHDARPMRCDAELCPRWTGQGCICAVMDMDGADG